MASESQAQQNDENSPAGDDRVFLVVIASDPTSMDDLLTALLDIGITGATLVESKGMAAVLREEMPIFAGLIALASGATGSRMLFSVTTVQLGQKVIDYVNEELRTDAKTIVVMMPILRSVGLGR